MTVEAIGGYFSLELPAASGMMHRQAFAFQSARTAFFALLQTRAPARAFVPHFICDAMLAPLIRSGTPYVFYDVDLNFHIAEDIRLAEGDILLYVNYFGLCDPYVREVVTRYGHENVVLDFSQAFFSECASLNGVLGTIYSPRKFFGVPDGGLLSTTLAIRPPQAMDKASVSRSSHLITRLAGDVATGYAQYQLAEQSLAEETEPRAMSHLTRRILDSVNFEEVRRIRNNNFNFLHLHLSQRNKLKFSPGAINGPMCYPLLVASDQIRHALIEQRIFVPQYWPDVIRRTSTATISAMLSESLTCIPVDQRYNSTDMMRIIDICNRFLDQPL